MRNGHHTVKASGDTRYTGPVEALPYPAGPVDPEAAAEAMFAEGYAIFPGVLSPEEVALWRRRMEAMGSGDDDDYVVPGWCYNKHIGMDFTADPMHLTLIDRPGVVDTAERVLSGGDGGGCRVIGGSYWTTGAGRAMGLHVDWLPVRVPEAVHDDPAFRLPVFLATAHFYLNDLTLEHGPTLVVPGSFRAGRPPQDETTWRGRAPQAALVQAGDVVLFRGDLWHGAAKNTHPTERRYLIQVHYAHGYLLPADAYGGSGAPPMRYESLYRPEVLAATTLRQRQLLRG